VLRNRRRPVGSALSQTPNNDADATPSIGTVWLPPRFLYAGSFHIPPADDTASIAPAACMSCHGGTILLLKLQNTLYLGENLMSKKAAEHHRKASEHLTHAASHHGEAAKHHDAGDHQKAAHHAHTARGHAIHARKHAEDAVMAHTEEHGKK
jgi:hypothetical protein